MANYLVIKLSGNWIKQEQNKMRIRMRLKGLGGVELLEKSAISCMATRLEDKKILDECPDCKDHIKESMSRDIGLFLAENGLIAFEESDRIMDGRADAMRRFTATVVAIKDGE